MDRKEIKKRRITFWLLFFPAGICIILLGLVSFLGVHSEKLIVKLYGWERWCFEDLTEDEKI